MTYTGNRFIDVLFIHNRHIGDRLLFTKERTGQAEKVTDHHIGKPVFLEFRKAVEDIKHAGTFRSYDAVYLHSEGLKAYCRIEGILFHVCTAFSERLSVNDLIVIAKTQVYDTLPVTGSVSNKLRRSENIVADVCDLPKNRIPCTQAINRLVKAFNTGTDAFVRIHGIPP